MKYKTRESGKDIEMDMTPMIDCIFQLIIFFMLATHYVAVEKTNLELPKAEEAKEEKFLDPKRLIINILPDGNKEVGGEAISEEELTKLLFQEAESSRDSGGNADRSILIRADKKTPYKYIAKILMQCAERKIWRLSFGVFPKDQK